MSEKMNENIETSDKEFEELYENLGTEAIENQTSTVDEDIVVNVSNDLVSIINDTSEEDIEESEETDSDEADNNSEEKTTTRRRRRKSTKTIDDSDDVDPMFERKVLRNVSKAEARKAIGGVRVITKEGDEDVYTEADEKREEWDRIANAIKNKKIILSGTIIGLDYAGEGAKKIALAVVQLKDSKGYYSIKIPASFLFPTTAEKYKGADGFNTIIRDMTFRIDSEIDFVVFDAKINRKEVYASRVHAMSRIGYENYLRVDDRTGRPRINNGDIVKAKITLVGQYGVFVEVCGAEVYIKSNELDYKHIDDCRKYYFAGDSINVRVNGIHTVQYKCGDVTLPMVMLEASKKQAEPNPADIFWDDFKVGSTYKGIVKFHNERGEYYVSLCNKIDCLCLPPNDGIPSMGQNCLVTVTHKNESENGNKLMRGKFIALLR